MFCYGCLNKSSWNVTLSMITTKMSWYTVVKSILVRYSRLCLILLSERLYYTRCWVMLTGHSYSARNIWESFVGFSEKYVLSICVQSSHLVLVFMSLVFHLLSKNYFPFGTLVLWEIKFNTHFLFQLSLPLFFTHEIVWWYYLSSELILTKV